MPRFLFALTALLLVVGCESTQGNRSALTLASARYEAGDFNRARDLAEPLRSHEQPQSEEAAWIIGLCDYRQGKLQQAETQFRFITTGTDKALAAQARVMLAQIDLSKGHPSLALASLSRAWSHLPSEHRRRAAELAVTAAKVMNDAKAEDQWLARMPSAPSRSTTEIKALRDRYTLQAGAYRNRSGAESLKSSLNGKDCSLGDASIRTRTDRRGRTLYLVQIGSFTTRAAADAARGELRGTELVVVAQ
ncbi:MAG: SPOR domain-containing protein [Phycisphaerales bacterium]|nr:SPOR domain-containing protein [Phycisphaerales bacterium]